MIESKLSTVINSVEVMRKLAASPTNGRTAYKVAKFLRRLEEEFELFNSSREKLLDKYAIKDEHGDPIVEDGNYKIELDRVDEFNQEVNNLLSTPVKIDLDPIALSEIESVEFTPNEIILIEDFIEE